MKNRVVFVRRNRKLKIFNYELMRAQQGDVETGLVFTGEYMPRIEKILPVREIISQLVSEAEEI